ncbi:hypothetical protein GMOD_00007479 [Pyrenophora seminiperda CCB06]|uniref:Uncharacterized protein n=1 Tax=Pyrenophora seminiperda CCB06 TaxID=1302712 RepID=A0A3M7MDB3_9PLEO|nr:hypothetical protein GMOD_00007479 [Pyrenophora seminiperda CCB06]
MPSPSAPKLVLLALLAPATAAPLLKRDQDYVIPIPLIILLIILGAGLLVCMGYAIYSMFASKQDGNGIKQMSSEQMEYMAEVRLRNMDGLMSEGRRGYRGMSKQRGDVVYN